MRMMSRLALAHMKLFGLMVMATITPALVHAQGGPMSGSASFQFSSDGYTIAAVKAGSGPAVIIVHGLGGRKEDFGGVIAAFQGSHTVYAFDMLGFGQSARTSPSVGINRQAEVVAALMAAENLDRAMIFGNSLGGWVAATFAARHPQKVAKLVLVDVAGLKVTLGGPPPVNFTPDTVEDLQKLLQTVIASSFAHSTEFAVKALADVKAGGEAATIGKLFAGFADPANKDRVLDEILPDIVAPTLVVWGAKDGLFPAVLADVVLAGLKDGRKVIMDDASHFPQIDSPKPLWAQTRDFAR
jgi:triacylglycerol lipase